VEENQCDKVDLSVCGNLDRGYMYVMKLSKSSARRS